MLGMKRGRVLNRELYAHRIQELFAGCALMGARNLYETVL